LAVLATFVRETRIRRGNAGDGGPAANALLGSATGVVIDGAGSIYIADSGNANIRKIGTDGTISTLVGQIVNPEILAVDSTGNLYVPDSGNCLIRKVDQKGNLSIFAGNGKCTTSGDGGLATTLAPWHIVSKEFRENLQWAVVVPGDGEISPAVTKLLDELAARGIAIHDSRLGPW
jgi:hypothetical protein